MKIADLLNETEDHMKTYWALKGVNIDSYYSSFNAILTDTNIFRRKNNLLELVSHVHALLINPSWEQLENDPDYDRVYESLYDLYETIRKHLKSM